MLQPLRSGTALLDDIDRADAVRPRLWWLGHCGFALKYYGIVFYLDPLLSPLAARRIASPLLPEAVSNADMILCTSASPLHLDPQTVRPLLRASRRAKAVLPKSAAERAHAAGIEYARMTTTDSDLRVEYFKNGVYARIYAVPAARPQLDWTPLGGYPYLGYLVRCGEHTFYHAGGSVPYPDLASRLRPYNVTVALIPVGGAPGESFTVGQAAKLAAEIGATWLVPMGLSTIGEEDGAEQAFTNHMLFHCPAQRFKVFPCGEGWQVPAPGFE